MTQQKVNVGKDVGPRLAELRHRKGKRQREVAHDLNISIKHRSEMERGVTMFSIEKLMEAADYYDCSMDYLLGREDEDVAIPSQVNRIMAIADEEDKELLSEYLTLFTRLRMQHA